MTRSCRIFISILGIVLLGECGLLSISGFDSLSADAQEPEVKWTVSPQKHGPVTLNIAQIRFLPRTQRSDHAVVLGELSLHPCDQRVSYAFETGPWVTIFDDRGMPVYSAETAPRRWVASIGIPQNGKKVRFTSAKAVLEWSEATRTVSPIYEWSQHERGVISPDGSSLALVDREASPNVLTVRKLDNPSSDQLSSSFRFEYIQLWEFLGNSRSLFVACSKEISKSEVGLIWDPVSDRRTKPLKVDVNYWNCPPAISTDGSRYAGKTPRHSLEVWDTETGELCFETGTHSGHVRAICFSPDGRFMASGAEGGKIHPLTRKRSEMGEIRIWDAKTGAEIKTLVIPDTWGITAVAFSPDSRLLAAGDGLKNIVHFWNVPAAKK